VPAGRFNLDYCTSSRLLDQVLTYAAGESSAEGEEGIQELVVEDEQ
jgi:hypothetical protein